VIASGHRFTKDGARPTRGPWLLKREFDFAALAVASIRLFFINGCSSLQHLAPSIRGRVRLTEQVDQSQQVGLRVMLKLNRKRPGRVSRREGSVWGRAGKQLILKPADSEPRPLGAPGELLRVAQAGAFSPKIDLYFNPLQ
jgi:hypothetical protein